MTPINSQKNTQKNLKRTAESNSATVSGTAPVKDSGKKQRLDNDLEKKLGLQKGQMYQILPHDAPVLERVVPFPISPREEDKTIQDESEILYKKQQENLERMLSQMPNEE